MIDPDRQEICPYCGNDEFGVGVTLQGYYNPLRGQLWYTSVLNQSDMRCIDCSTVVTDDRLGGFVLPEFWEVSTDPDSVEDEPIDDSR